MKTLKQINIKNCPNYFFNSMTNIENLDTDLLFINRISFTSIDSVVYSIEYFTNLDSVNSLYLVFNDADAYFEENYKELWDEIKVEMETIKGIEPTEYEKKFLKIKFESNNELTFWLCNNC